VLDTGVRKDHPDLAGRLVGGYDFVSDSLVANDGDGRDADASDPGDWVTTADTKTTKFSGCTAGNSSWHGTSTASLVGAGANDGVGMAGTAPGVRVLPVRVLGKCFGTDADIQAGMRWAAGISVSGVPDNPNPAKVLNMSLGSSGACSAAYQSAVDDVLAKGAVIVASAGNSAGEPVGTPANCKGVIAVLALRHVGTKVGFSDMGPEIAIAAPGGNCVNTAAGSPCLYPILAADNTGTQGPVSSAWTNSFNPSLGTSFSAPLVAATVGLMFSQQAVLTPAQVLAALKSTATAFPTTGGDNGDGSTVAQCHAPSTGVEQLQCYCTTSFCGAGMLNAGAAVAAVSGPLARIGITTASPAAGSAVTLSAESSSPGGGVAIVSYLWTLVDGGGIATAFSSATNASTATLTPTAQGNFVVNLRVTDSQGRSNETSQTVTVAAAPVVAAAPSGGGGGAASVTWVLLLLAGAVALWRAPPGGRPKAPSRKA
jgi:serine protease